ncbi:MAG: type VI secretion system-associated FHA domain protein TagH [Acetobacteraceae bacterium]|nr:type VI secretion system-associated FHA domain protein TagH [Acetobacteraceae bacterium]
MGLTLSVLRCPDAVPPETRHVPGGEFSIGRGTDNDWTLADPDRTLSRRHCVLAFRSGGWQLADVSANGTFLNREATPVGDGGPRDLRDGDRLRLGAYEIEIRISAEAAWQGGAPAAGQMGGDPFGDDPFAPGRKAGGAPEGQGFGQDPLLGDGGFGPPSVTLPDDFGGLTPRADESGFRHATQPDHTPALEQSFRVPTPPDRIDFDDWDLDVGKVAAGVPLSSAGGPPTGAPPAGAPQPGTPPAATANALDDWDIDLSPAAPAQPAPPVARAAPAPAAAPPEPPGAQHDPFAEPERDHAASEAMPPARAVRPPPATPAGAASGAPAAGAVPASGDLLAAFLRGAGMEDARPADAEVAMERLGAAFRAVVTGLRQTLIARATIKGEFRIEQTMIRARGNNPLKFSAGDDDALAALLGAGRRTDMAPAEAVSEALDDIRLHELAAMAAMQAAVRALVARFDPAPLRAEGDKSGGVLGAQKRARAFELFEKLHGEITEALADDFDSVFGKAFARAYEQALREVSERNRG